jgi:hypothetical protein
MSHKISTVEFPLEDKKQAQEIATKLLEKG